ncbi:MAG TPA: FAD-dependent oxidoreductase [Lachnospiraceae bacterium]|nr:FAD-dependent oxidoreductase [Lachnospiraceae bacterium]
MIKVDNLKLPIGHTDDDLSEKLEKTLKLNKYGKDLSHPGCSFRILKRSLDARKKPELFYVYSLLVTLEDGLEEKVLRNVRDRNVSAYQPVVYRPPEVLGDKELTGRPLIIGAGPAGLFCAYELSKRGYAPMVIERGERVEKRIETVKEFFRGGRLNTESNVQFGEGGAGTFSDGKLNTGVNDKMGRNQYVLNTLVSFGAPEEIAYTSRPHIGTDILAIVVRNMREEIIKNGGEFLFETKMTGFDTDEHGITGVKVVNDGNESAITSNCMILAIGHSSRDTFTMLKDKNVDMTLKAFAVGLRIQHPQEMIDMNQYGVKGKEGPGPADYKLTNRTSKGRNVYSFCMCPGGYVVNASSEDGRLCVNGMSYSGRSSLNANSAIIVSVTGDDFGSDDVLAGMEFQRRLEEKAYELGGGTIPVQEYGDFKSNTLSGGGGGMTPQIKGDYKLANLRELLPDEINEAIIESIDKFGYTIEGFDRNDAILAGVESRTSSPVRILRNDNYEGSIKGLYPCGEGAGYAGGITSAAMDGIKAAEAIMKKYRPLTV